MKGLPLVAIALVVAGSIAFALSGTSRSNVGSGSQTAERDEPHELLEPLGWDSCLCDFNVLYCVQSEEPGKCTVGFIVKHLEQGDLCCNHATPSTVSIRVNDGPAQSMTRIGTCAGDPCDKEEYTSGGYNLPDGEQATIQFTCSGHDSCRMTQFYTPHCSE